MVARARIELAFARIFSLEKSNLIITVDDLKSPNTANLTRENRFFARKDCPLRSIDFKLRKSAAPDIFRIFKDQNAYLLPKQNR